MTYVDNATVSNILFYNDVAWSLYTTYCDGITISGNKFSEFGGVGIYAGYSSGVIEGNYFNSVRDSSASKRAVTLAYNTGLVVANNVIENIHTYGDYYVAGIYSTESENDNIITFY